MKKLLILVLVSAMLLFGCVQIPVGPSGPTGNLTIPNVSGVVNQTLPPAQTCSPSYTVTPPAPAALSASAPMSVSATCAANKLVSVELNGAQVASASVPAGDSALLNFNLVASPDGTDKIVVKSDGSQVYSADWTVTPIGYFNTAGTDNDQISIKNWKAVAFNADNPITITKVGAFLRRLQSQTLAGSEIVAEIRADSNGVPGDAIVSQGSVPITSATLTPNWVSIPVSAQLQQGRYWIVFHVYQPGTVVVSDSVNIQYFAVDKTKPGNANHMKMDLTLNNVQNTWEQTTWQPLAYDRNYAFSVSASG